MNKVKPYRDSTGISLGPWVLNVPETMLIKTSPPFSVVKASQLLSIMGI